MTSSAVTYRGPFDPPRRAPRVPLWARSPRGACGPARSAFAVACLGGRFVPASPPPVLGAPLGVRGALRRPRACLPSARAPAARGAPSPVRRLRRCLRAWGPTPPCSVFPPRPSPRACGARRLARRCPPAVLGSCGPPRSRCARFARGAPAGARVGACAWPACGGRSAFGRPPLAALAARRPRSARALLPRSFVGVIAPPPPPLRGGAREGAVLVAGRLRYQVTCALWTSLDVPQATL